MKKIQARKKYQTSEDAAKHYAVAGGADNDDEVVDEKNDEEVAPYLARQSAPGLSSSILVKDPLPALPALPAHPPPQYLNSAILSKPIKLKIKI